MQSALLQILDANGNVTSESATNYKVKQTMNRSSNSVTVSIKTGPAVLLSGPPPVPPSAPFKFSNGLGTFTFPFAAGAQASFAGSYLPPLTSVNTGFTQLKVTSTINGLTATDPAHVRCDNNVGGGSPAVGCVNPLFTPDETDMQSLPNIAANIREQQATGAPKTLHRLRDANAIGRNRYATCDVSKVGPPPLPGLQCDEYPFASSYEGGQEGRYKWVLAEENSAQGTFLLGLYNDNQIMDGDAYNVVVN